MTNDFAFPPSEHRNPFAEPAPPNAALALPVPTPLSRRWWMRALFWLVLFFSGVIFGSSATLIGVRNEVVRVIHRPELAVPKVTERIRKELSLNTAQTAKVEVLARQRQLALQALRREFQPRLEHELNLFQEQVADVLDAKQRERWQMRIEQFRKLWFPPLAEGTKADAAPESKQADR